MTRAKALKQLIRARATKTGERYTTARRHVLKERVTLVAAPSPARPAMAHNPKGSVSDAKSVEKTGHGLDHWFAVLDRFGGAEKGHTALARHLNEAHAVDGWYAQGITVAYERARGARALNQRCDGDYEVSVSKVVSASVTAIVTAFSDARQRRQWLGVADAALIAALAAALDRRTSKTFFVRPDGQARFRYKWDETTVQMNLYPKPGGKVSVVVTNTKLPTADLVAERRTQWRAALAALASHMVD